MNFHGVHHTKLKSAENNESKQMNYCYAMQCNCKICKKKPLYIQENTATNLSMWTQIYIMQTWNLWWADCTNMKQT